MASSPHRCKNCGYPLEAQDAGLCLPCLVADAKKKMSVGLLGCVRCGDGLDERQPTSPLKTIEQSIAKTKKRSANPEKKAKSKKAKLMSEKRRTTGQLQSPAQPIAQVKNGPAKLKSNKSNPRVVDVSAYQTRRLGRGSSGLNCVLCGARVAFGEMLAHKEKVHGEARVSRSQTGLNAGRSVWVSIFQGGLPGLGKRH